MPLESATTINQLDPANPPSGDPVAQADDHLRLIKSTLKNTFPNVTAAITVDAAFLNSLVNRIAVLEAGNYIGKITASARSSTPPRHLLCQGQEVSRTTYADLFAAIGTTWGTGNGTTTFNVPDLRGRFLVGVDGGTNRVTSAVAALANLGGTGGSQWLHQHLHSINDPGHFHTGNTSTNGDHVHSGNTDVQGDHGHGMGQSWGLDASQGSAASNQFGGGSIGIRNFTDIAGAHNHNFVTSVAGNHNHDLTTTTNGTGITGTTNSGSGNSQNIPPAAAVNYVIFAGV
jgi:microcystin-dependent protein